MDQCVASRTFDSLRETFWSFYHSGGNSATVKQFGNSLHLPILRYSDDVKVLEKFPPPELHLLIGVVTKLFKKLLKQWNGADRWLSEVHVDREFYHGGSFTGNSVKKLLNNINKLEELAAAEEQCQPYIDAFSSFQKVVDARFGNELLEYFEARRFEETYLKLDIPVTPKVHIVIFHVPELCNEFRRGLGIYSKQATESVHYDFDSFGEKYKVNRNHPEFGSHLLKAVSAYNAHNI